MSGRPLFQFCRVFFVGKKPAMLISLYIKMQTQVRFVGKVSIESECDGTTDEIDTLVADVLVLFRSYTFLSPCEEI